MADDKRAEKVAVGRKMLEKYKKKNKESINSPKKQLLEDSGGAVIRDTNVQQTESIDIDGFSNTHPAFTTSNESSDLHENSSTSFSSNMTTSIATPIVSQTLFKTSPTRVRHNSAADFFDNLDFNTVTDSKQFTRQSDVHDNTHSFLSSPTEVSSNKSTSSSMTAYPLQNTPENFEPILAPNIMKNDLDLQVYEIKLQEEQERNKMLENKLKEYKVDINRLEEILAQVRIESGTKVTTLEEKLELHCKTLEILVGEKTELQNNLARNQEELQVKLGELEEVQNRLKASRHRVSDLEREISHANAQQQHCEKSEKEAREIATSLNTELNILRKHLEEREGEMVDLKGQLEGKANSVVMLEQQLSDTASQLALAQLRVQQLSSADDIPTSEVDQLQQDKLQLEHMVSDLEKQLSLLRNQNEETSRDYQQYVNSLNLQIQNLTVKDEVTSNQMADVVLRNQQLIQHVSDLEKQLQNANKLRAPPPPQPQVDPALQKQVAVLQEAKNQLELRLQQQTTECEELHSLLDNRAEYIEKLESNLDMLDSEKLDTVSLQAAIESDKVAASRAMAQNKDLKKQLEELSDAFVALKNSNLELTEKLEHERHMTKDLSDRLAALQTQASERKPNGILEVETSQQTDTTVMFTSAVQTVEANFPEVSASSAGVSTEAMAKLEEKFRKKMQELAELSDEKQRLEHLVDQLQYETDTIGEYVTLYQKQRGLLRQRAQEKDEQVTKLAQEREMLRQKLAQLNCLVRGLLDGKPHHHQNGYDSNPPEEAQEVLENNLQLEKTNDDSKKVETAGKIMALLSDITTNKLMTAEGVITPEQSINFHPCPWCSGKLITI